MAKFDKTKMNSEQKEKARKKKKSKTVPRKQTVTVTIDIGESVLEAIDDLAQDDIRSRSNYIAYSMMRYVKMRNKKQPGILDA